MMPVKLSSIFLLLLIQSATELYAQYTAPNLNGSRIASGRRAQQNSNRLPQAQPQGDIEGLYQEGIFALQNGDWLEAVIALEKVSWLNSEYKEIQNKLADARFNLENKIQAGSRSGSDLNFLVVLGWGLFFSLVPLFGLFLFSANVRARFYLMQGEYGKAAAIFATIVKKHPEKFKIYQILANIYLLDNRKDESALEVFEMALRLNLSPDRNQEINSIVANHYLNQGRSDAVAIEVMEKELNAKILKLKNG